mmetsp:Transcript_51994/g.135359  ORF Transcript_51994/g.135359 Transcript_51994/m.135359 type:complete len:252 (-) Transcript_51994:1385-2140(-)
MSCSFLCSLMAMAWRALRSRSLPLKMSAAIFAFCCSAPAARNCCLAAISLSSFFSRSSSSRFRCFFSWIFRATSCSAFSRCLATISSCSCFFLFASALLYSASAFALSRILASVSTFSLSSCCFCSFFSSRYPRLSSTSFCCLAAASASRSRSSARDISSSRPWQGASAGSNILNFSTGTLSSALICLMMSFLLSISSSSSRFFLSISASSSARTTSAASARAFSIASVAWRACSRSDCTMSTSCCFPARR